MTIQGEGALAGAPTLFVRFGGCDYRCSWCDSMYAVDPAEVRENAEKLTAAEIVDRCKQLAQPTIAPWLWVTLSGGNPALMHYLKAEDDFVALLQEAGFRVAVETQGSIWRQWLLDVDHLTVSPKPPSSGMVTLAHMAQTSHFLIVAESKAREERSLKIVVFDENDYEYAAGCFAANPNWQHFLSVGTDQDHLQDEYRVHAGIADRYRWLCDTVANDPRMHDVRALPQMHVIAFGTGRGV